MNKKRKIFLIGSLTVAMLGTLAFAGCASSGVTIPGLREDGYNLVTFDIMDGEWASGGVATRHIAVPQDALIPEKQALEFASANKTGYTFAAYYRGVENADGSITYGEKWNFSTDRVTEDITLYAKWLQDYKINVHYGDNLVKEVTVPQDGNGVAGNVTTTMVSISGYTVFGYYGDAEKQSPITFPYQPDCSVEHLTDEIWADAIEGTYQIIRTANDLTAFNFASATNLYFLTDVNMQDIYDAGNNVSFPTSYSGTILGNGHKISNLKIKQAPTSRSDYNFGIFKRLTGNATIKDITFENVTFEAKLDNPTVADYFVGMLAGSAASTVKLENVKVSGTLSCEIVESHFDATDVSAFVGEGAPTTTGCDYSGVTVEKRKP